jgi:hypothetical protein
MTSPLTLGRQAAWQAIDSWTALKDGAGKSIFARQDRFESSQPTRPQIESGYGPGDLPAIAIVSQGVSLQAITNRTQAWFFDLAISVWTPDWDQLAAERIAPEIVNALFAATPPNVTVTFLENPTTGTGYPPDSIPGIRFNFTGVGKDAATKAVRTDITCRLRLHFSPYEQ